MEAPDTCESVDLSLALDIRPRLELVDPVGVVGQRVRRRVDLSPGQPGSLAFGPKQFKNETIVRA